MKSKYLLSVLISLLILIFACTPQQENQKANTQAPPSEISKEKISAKSEVAVQKSDSTKGVPVLKIISPSDGDLIKSSALEIKVSAENFKLVPVGSPVKDAEGHFHVWLDSEKKLGPQTAFTFDKIISGKHTIVAELVKSDHSPLNPKITKTITINVESNYVPEKTQQQEGATEFTVEADDNGMYPNKLGAKIGDKVKINFKFRDSSIYFAGLDVKGPFPTIQYRLKGQQPVTAEFTMKEKTKITSYWPSSGVKKADLFIEVAQ